MLATFGGYPYTCDRNRCLDSETNFLISDTVSIVDSAGIAQDSRSLRDQEAHRMWESRPVELVVQLPENVAADVEKTHAQDPSFLSKVIRYGIIRRAIFEELKRTAEDDLPAA